MFEPTDRMLREEETAVAIAAAREALSGEQQSWIRSSALRERAYWTGLHNGLSAVCPEHTLRPLMIYLANTVFEREGDDPNSRGDVRVAYEAALRQLEEHRASAGELAESIGSVRAALERAAERSRNTHAHAAHLLEAMELALTESDCAAPIADRSALLRLGRELAGPLSDVCAPCGTMG